jgi:hypothetical protein
MTTTGWAGTIPVRLATVGMAGLALWLTTAAAGSAAFYAALGAWLLTFLGVVHWSGRILAAWMRFAEALHRVAVRVLFGACYLLIVPFFVPVVRIRDPLGLRGRRTTAWVAKRGEMDLPSMERMG